MPLVDALLPEFDHEVSTTRKLLERVPEDALDWKPHAKSMTLGQLATHVANLPRWGLITVNESQFDLAADSGTPPATSRKELLSQFDGITSETRKALVGKSDAELMAPWTLKRGPETIFTSPKAMVWRSFVLNHLIHHRGQLSVYLRLRDVPVPSIYGPSADERPI